MVKKVMRKALKKYVASKKKPSKFFWGEKPLLQKIQIPLLVHARSDGIGNHTYSFNATSASLNKDINSLLDSSNEFVNLKNRYKFFKLNGVSIQAENCMAPSNSLTGAPPVYFMLVPDLTGISNVTPVVSDTHLKVFPLSGSRTPSKYYDMGEVSNSSAGYPLTGLWRTTIINGSSSFYLCLGYQELPAGLAPSTNVQVVSLLVQVYCQFTCRTAA